ncbi:MAG: 2-oxo acid dehydrogenase subunit E2 [Chloroflexi bacterium]|nr:2-oxo acid dehydrogenase subunit E2 [Chloroflexota bacterium]
MAELIIMPKLGFDMAEGTLLRWLISEGDQLAQGDVIAEIETDKATIEVESQFSGVVRKLVVEEGSSVPIGAPIAIVADAGESIDFETILAASASSSAEPADPAPEPRMMDHALSSSDGNGRLPGGVKASPVARRLAEEFNINLKSLEGSGQGGRIVKRDVEHSIAGQTDEASKVSLPVLPQLEGSETVEAPLTKLRGLIGRRMTSSKQEIPHFYLTSSFDAAAFMKMRSDLNARMPAEEKFSIHDFILKAAGLALRKFPNLNASLGDGKIIRHGAVNIGLAVAVEGGLLTVVIRDVDWKPLRIISTDARAAIQRARAGRVHQDDVEGSTFTVSNLGMYSIDSFVAIINPPEAAILAIGSVEDVAVVKDGEIVPGKRFKATLSADHRVTDGAEAAEWLQIFKGFIEDPLLLLL